MPAEYPDWQLFKPSKDIKADYSNITQVIGTALATFKASYPVQKPRQVVETTETGDSIVQTSVYRIDIISLPLAISKKHLLKIAGTSKYYQPTVEAGPDLIGRNVSLEVKLIGAQ